MFSLCLSLFSPGQGPSESWLVSASGNNAFKADFIRRTPGRKAFKAALKEMCQATWHMLCAVCVRVGGLRSGLRSGMGKVLVFSVIKQALHFRHALRGAGALGALVTLTGPGMCGSRRQQAPLRAVETNCKHNSDMASWFRLLANNNLFINPAEN